VNRLRPGGPRFSTWVRVATAYPAAVLRLMSRDRTALFFSFLLPVALIVLVGVAFGGTSRLDVGWVDLDHGEVSRGVTRDIGADEVFNARRFTDVNAMRAALRRKEIVAGLVIPAGTGEVIDRGGQAPMQVLTQTGDSQGVAAFLALQGAVASSNATLAATRAVQDSTGGSFSHILHVARDASDASAKRVEVRDVGSTATTINRFSLTASQNLVLFVFTTALISATFVVAARRHGVLRRSLSTRASPAQVMTGLCLAILIVTFAQSVIIVGLGSIVFGIDWGDPLAATLLIVTTDIAAAAAGIFLGVVGRNPDRTASMAPIIGVGLAVIGGCVIPLELFPGSLLGVAHAVPQFWAVSGWQSLIFDGSGVGGVVGDLAVLASMAVTLFVVAILVFRRQLAATRT
jgi:ABC-2 type transport system permease protein